MNRRDKLLEARNSLTDPKLRGDYPIDRANTYVNRIDNAIRQIDSEEKAKDVVHQQVSNKEYKTLAGDIKSGVETNPTKLNEHQILNAKRYSPKQVAETAILNKVSQYTGQLRTQRSHEQRTEYVDKVCASDAASCDYIRTIDKNDKDSMLKDPVKYSQIAKIGEPTMPLGDFLEPETFLPELDKRFRNIPMIKQFTGGDPGLLTNDEAKAFTGAMDASPVPVKLEMLQMLRDRYGLGFLKIYGADITENESTSYIAARAYARGDYRSAEKVIRGGDQLELLDSITDDGWREDVKLVINSHYLNGDGMLWKSAYNSMLNAIANKVSTHGRGALEGLDIFAQEILGKSYNINGAYIHTPHDSVNKEDLENFFNNLNSDMIPQGKFHTSDEISKGLSAKSVWTLFGRTPDTRLKPVENELGQYNIVDQFGSYVLNSNGTGAYILDYDKDSILSFGKDPYDKEYTPEDKVSHFSESKSKSISHRLKFITKGGIFDVEGWQAMSFDEYIKKIITPNLDMLNEYLPLTDRDLKNSWKNHMLRGMANPFTLQEEVDSATDNILFDLEEQ